MKAIRSIVIVVGFALSMPIEAEENIDCSKAVSTLEVNHCLSEELKQADGQLNETYQGFLNTLKSMEEFGKMPKGLLVEGLRKAEREWMAYRDRNCEFYSNLAYGGTAAGTDYVSCQVKMTKERLNELKKEAEFWKDKGY